MLCEFVKEKRRFVGCVVACLVDGKIKISWSKCNVDAGDKFNRQAALDNAKERCKSQVYGIDVDKVDNTKMIYLPDGHKYQGKRAVTIPHRCRKVMRKIAIRAKRYFKQSCPNPA